MLAAKAYKDTVVGEIGTMTHAGLVVVGGPLNPIAGYEAFAAEVARLEAMERQGLVTIISRHTESLTGKRYVDIVKFKRLK